MTREEKANILNCCKACTDRYVGCHNVDKCEKWRERQSIVVAEKERRDSIKRELTKDYNYKKEACKRMKRSKKSNKIGHNI